MAWLYAEKDEMIVKLDYFTIPPERKDLANCNFFIDKMIFCVIQTSNMKSNI